MSEIPQPLGVIGAGAVGRTLARLWHESGLRLGWVACRRLESATEATRFIGAGIPTDDPCRAVTGARLIALTVPDREIAPLARRLRESAPVESGAIAFHTSGALASDLLEPLHERGLRIGSLHPLQSFAEPSKALDRIEGITFAIEGDETARPVLAGLAERIGGRPLELRTDQKVLYHAAAVIASNYTVSLAEVARGLLESIGADPAQALRALLPLFEGTLHNLREVGLPGALTGPIARGDATTVTAHLEALDRLDAKTAALYRDLGRVALSLAMRRTTLPAATRDALAHLLATAGNTSPDRFA